MFYRNDNSEYFAAFLFIYECLMITVKVRNMWNFVKANTVFVIKEKSVEQNCLFYLVYETQWDVISKVVLQTSSAIRPGCVAGCSLHVSPLATAYICCILQILAIISFNPNIYTEFKKNLICF